MRTGAKTLSLYVSEETAIAGPVVTGPIRICIPQSSEAVVSVGGSLGVRNVVRGLELKFNVAVFGVDLVNRDLSAIHNGSAVNRGVARKRTDTAEFERSRCDTCFGAVRGTFGSVSFVVVAAARESKQTSKNAIATTSSIAANLFIINNLFFQPETFG